MPSTASAVVLELSSYNSSVSSWVSQYPLGSARPTSSVLNPQPGLTVTNLVVAKLGSKSSIVLYNYDGTTDLTATVVGYLTGAIATTTGNVNTPLPAFTLLNTASVGGGGPLVGGVARSVSVAGVGPIPTGVADVVLNVTVTSGTRASGLSVYATGGTRPAVPSLSWTPGQTVSQLVIVPVSSAGSITLYNASGSANVTVTAEGFYSA